MAHDVCISVSVSWFAFAASAVRNFCCIFFLFFFCLRLVFYTSNFPFSRQRMNFGSEPLKGPLRRLLLLSQLQHVGHLSCPKFTIAKIALAISERLSVLGSVMKCIFPQEHHESSGVDPGRDRGQVHLSDGRVISMAPTQTQGNIPMSSDRPRPREASRGSRYRDTDQSFQNTSPFLSVIYTTLHVQVPRYC